jgi:hypothetical protein
MKQIAFITKSKLSQNLMGLLVPSLGQKISYVTFDSFETASAYHFAKPVHVMIFDQNVFDDLKDECDWSFFEKPNLKKSEKILIYARHRDIDTGNLRELGFTAFHAKPFLPEELIELLKHHL